MPESIAMVLWGTDNLKTEGAPIAQVLALLGARPRFDSYGRLAGAVLIPLDELARPTHRRGGDTLGNFSRPAAVTDQVDGGGCFPGRLG